MSETTKKPVTGGPQRDNHVSSPGSDGPTTQDNHVSGGAADVEDNHVSGDGVK
ncbi:hypothetical protein [Streptomyces sp. CNQ085]|uniref:hypothetical protein n=1 Tax=Streptomyces sp. CNQ085 TaxID=2886944 RepID=UPI001F5107FA|nr:hypothetical protein [Streptomyces sp. CNQ085]MCI0383841.1 hypothetical protein [Streptomyces sp. CNQ085]